MATALSLSHQTISNFPRSNYDNVERPQLPVTSQGYFHPLSQTSQHIPPSSSQCLFNEKSKGRTVRRSLSNSSLIFPVPSEGTTSACRQVELRKPSDASLQFYGEGSDISGNSLLPFERRSSTNQTTQQYARPNNVTPLFSALNVPQPQLNSPASDERESFSNQHINIGRNNQPSCVSAQGQSLSSSEESFTPSSAKSLAYIKAQKILQSQLLDKQNHLQQIIVNQKAQLNRIQEQIIVNAQAQFSLHDIGDLESSKQLQQRIHSLETERQKHEEKHKELQILFQQKFQEVSPLDQYDTNEALEDTSKHIPASDVDLSRTSRDVQKCDNFLVQTFPNASTAPKTFEYKRYPSQQSSSSAQDIEDDLFSGVVATEKAKQHFTHFYSPIMQTFNSSYKIAASQETMNHTKVIDSQNIGTFSTVNPTNNHGKDYFSQFSTSELESFLSSSTYPAKSLAQNADRSESNAVNEKSSTTPSTYDSLLLQQKRLLEMQEEQRRQLLKRQQEQFLRLKLQQQQQQQMLVDLQHSDKDEINDPQPSSQNISEGGIAADDSSCVITNELNEDDLNVLNMLLAEEAGTEMWTEESIFQKGPSSSSS
ncbi:uncharacterized protein LOC124447569 [Xenia sp. Carnegie-2017]|uniref:uncharacterized protein LOC124447569 n=1 Tax=Xenia sp. Carnegie-2017 TaxID=2897299 RepID=UPI001F03EEC9|nr:uncharacterized protein LOC124447569 [Xenia sp. Carnegie-2017]